MPCLSSQVFITAQVEQNKDISKSRQARDMKDTQTLLVTLAEKSPFAPHDHLMNVMTGVHAKESVNVERAKEMGQNILDSMTGKSAAEFSFKSSNQVITFSAKSSIKVGSAVVISPSHHCLPLTG